MAYFTLEQWVALSAMGGTGILAILWVLATRLEHERSLHDLRLRATSLRRDYSARMAALKAATAEEPIEVDVIGEISPEQAAMAQAA